MHGYTAKDLGRAFRTVRENTIQIAEEIPEEKYTFRPAEGSRSVAETLAHIVRSPAFHMQIHGERRTELKFEDFRAAAEKRTQEEAQLTSKHHLVKALYNKGDEFARFLEAFPDEALAETVRFPANVQPNVKTRFEMLLSLKEHEMHHRAQLMVVERMLGIVPHLTRRMQERIAQATQQAGAS
jgi:uncharacterized damage-inducible protein DinB